MSNSKKKTVLIQSMDALTDDVFSMWLKDEEIAANATPGQFVSLYCNEGSRLLPRPISICEIDKAVGAIRLVYRVVGKGTEEFSKMKKGDTIEVMGPLGNGFPLDNEGKKVILIGGGIGIPPMLELSKHLTGEKQVVLGYRDELFLEKEFESYGKVYISTEDGSVGTKGNVIDAIKENGLDAEVIYACGPTPMLRGIKAYAIEHGITAWLSLEEKMACGIGACLACVCKSKEVDHHTNVDNKRICKEGPVFNALEVEL
ncbi:dihydroorotate dehydrogenase electron transfer subunit [Anaeromicropila herbilytica]|uniref:Dihydroorotate dehydrogenase B (NAD(+)), electron transfer subunit n=1 Tax=Anaeromicropila herbilytica TaxID=2785025 RepID=A0A7R7EJY4_9FIRM|nr:dihydroorotate dehydrogenase electron transfer subunit [Anaeromicropila herbilytica]BCN30236.1 dihydroorotate dehydrogenase B (NAD(+)), electron transfer subunit [Anaeromicropila herbilytica]